MDGAEGDTDVVVGVDGFRERWVWVTLAGGPVVAVGVADSVEAIADGHREAAVIGVDVPIGLPVDGRGREADVAAKRFLGSRSASVFPAPPADVLRQPTHRRATAHARERYGHGISIQSYGLGPKILAVDAVAAGDDRLIEVHPEVSFRAVAGRPLEASKKTWNGQMERRSLLAGAGIELPDHLEGGAGAAGADDVLDAAVVAWSARRHHRGEARPLPDPPQLIDGRRVAIWY